MVKFKVEVPEVHYATYEVEAEDAAAAFSQVADGITDEELVSTEYSHTLMPYELKWRVVDPDGVTAEFEDSPLQETEGESNAAVRR